MTASAIYVGTVTHRRLRPRSHFLRYRIFQLHLDLDEAPALSRSSRLFGFNRPALLSFHERDHGDGSERPLKAQIEARLLAAGLAGGGPVRVMSLPRVLGYAFNPISVYFCHDADGRLSALVHEVNSTFGERCFYVLPGGGGPAIRQSAQKRMHVSPFLEMDHRYDFRTMEPSSAFALAIDVRRGEETWLSTAFTARRRAFTDGALLAAFLGHPMVTLKVILAIHFEALKLWLKGVPPRAAPPKEDAEVIAVR